MDDPEERHKWVLLPLELYGDGAAMIKWETLTFFMKKLECEMSLKGWKNEIVQGEVGHSHSSRTAWTVGNLKIS